MDRRRREIERSACHWGFEEEDTAAANKERMRLTIAQNWILPTITDRESVIPHSLLRSHGLISYISRDMHGLPLSRAETPQTDETLGVCWLQLCLEATGNRDGFDKLSTDQESLGRVYLGCCQQCGSEHWGPAACLCWSAFFGKDLSSRNKWESVQGAGQKRCPCFLSLLGLRTLDEPHHSQVPTGGLPVQTDMPTFHVPLLWANPGEANMTGRRPVDFLNGVEGRVPCSRCTLLSGRHKAGMLSYLAIKGGWHWTDVSTKG